MNIVIKGQLIILRNSYNFFEKFCGKMFSEPQHGRVLSVF